MTTRVVGRINPPLDLDRQLWVRLKKLAETSDRSVSELVSAALRSFLDENDRHLAAIDAGIAATDAGELIDFAEVEADVEKKLAALGSAHQ
jgi:predicted transcriptional regulator